MIQGIISLGNLLLRKAGVSPILACEKEGLSLLMFQSGYSDLLQGEDEASMKHLSLYSLASHQMLSLELSVGATGLWLGPFLVSFNTAI